MLPFVFEYEEGFVAGFEMLLRAPRGSNGVGASPSSSSSSDESSDTDVASLCSTVEASDSDDVSDAVDGSYSCLRGEEDRLCLARPFSRFGVFVISKTGLADEFCDLGLTEDGRFLDSLLGEAGKWLYVG